MANIRSEADLRRFVVGIPSYHWTMLESHDVGVGVPDVVGYKHALDLWLELKTEPNLRKTQYLWMKKRLKHRGNASGGCWVVWYHKEKFYLISMENAVELADNADIEKAETILSNHFTSTEISWLQHRLRVLPAFSIRFELIEKAI